MCLDPTARQELFNAHTDWARGLARRYSAKSLLHAPDASAAENAALTGLWQASARWKPEQKISFKTFAKRRVIGEIQDQARSQDCVPRRAVAIREGKKIPQIFSLSMSSRKASQDESGDLFNAFQRQAEAADNPDMCETNELIEIILNTLKGKKLTVITLHFFQNLSLPEIAKKLGYSSNYICMLKNSALRELRETFSRMSQAQDRRKAAN